MRQSTLLTKTRKFAPKDEEARNAELLIRAGYIHKEMAGVYTLLPLGWRVIQKIENIIRQEMDAVGGQEMHLTALQKKDIWEKSGRWDDAVLDVWFKTTLAGGGELGLGTTHEEPLTALLTEQIASYRDLPRYPYQIQTKFRNELRAKSGILRGREFRMKDLYSFSKTAEEHELFYEKMKEVYGRVFARVGIAERTYLTFASGGSFCPYSHEFQMLTDAGEDTVYVDTEKKIAVNEEVYTDEVLAELGLSKETLVAQKALEVGNIFSLGTKFSDALNLQYRDEEGNMQPVIMGSYGIGSTRLMGAVVEALADEKGMVFPHEIAPYQIHLISLARTDEVQEEAEKLYAEYIARGVEVLYDDRDKSAGEKFADSDLLGIPTRIVISDRGLAEGVFEVVDRATGAVEKKTREEIRVL